ncbi:MAG: tail fiber domain-containing protein [bacterium]
MTFGRKTLFSVITILSIIGYGFVVFAVAPVGGYTPAQTLNPACAPGDIDCVVQMAVVIGSSVISGMPNQVLYTDTDGKVFGDSQFTRDSTTGNTIIGVANGVVASNMSILNTGNVLTWDADVNDSITDGLIQGNNLNGVGIKGSALAHSNTSTFESASFFAGDTTAVGGNPYEASMAYVLPGGINGAFAYTVNEEGLKADYYDSVGNIKSQILQEATGNTILWDADTTDDIQDLFAQNQNIGGSPFKGNGIAHVNTATGENVYLGIGDASGVGQRPFTGIIGYQNAGGTLLNALRVDDRGAVISHRDSVANTQGFMTTFGGGNLSVWKADTTDTIITKLEQTQDILGLGAFSGSALTWQDTGTQVTGLVGAVDGTGTGLFPGSTIMATTNDASLASASLSTNYDTLSLQATLIANVANGPGDTGFEFDRTRGIIRRRDYGTGFESAFEVNGNNAIAKYTLNGTNEYQTQLGDGTFAFLNTTTNDKYLSLDSVSGIMKIAPPTGGDFEVNTLTTNKVAFTVIPDNFYVKMGDGDNVANHTSLTVDDASQAITFGYTGSSYTFPVGDGTTNYLLATDGTGQLFWQDPTMVPSDRSLKSNIGGLSYGLDTLMQLNPVSYTMNSSGKEQIGFIAQEVESLVPELVGEVANGKKGLAYGQMTAVIVKSVQQLNLKIVNIENFADAENKTFLNNLIAWLGSAANGLGKLFAGEVETKKLCIADDTGSTTCITKSQLDEFLTHQNNSPGSSVAPIPPLDNQGDNSIPVPGPDLVSDSVPETGPGPLPVAPDPISDPVIEEVN